MTPAGIEPATFRFVADTLATVLPRSPFIIQYQHLIVKNILSFLLLLGETVMRSFRLISYVMGTSRFLLS